MAEHLDRVLYIHQHFTTPDGATGTRSYEFAKRLVNRGHKVTMLCSPHQLAKHPADKYSVEGINVEVMPLNQSYSNKDGFWARLKKFFQFMIYSVKQVFKRRHDYDLVIATSTPLSVGLPGIFAKCFCHKKFIFEVRDQWPELLVAMGALKNPVFIFFARQFEKLCYRFADVIIVLAPGIKKNIEAMGYVASKVHFIPNGCDFYSKSEGEVNTPWKKSSFIAVFTGAHGAANGLWQLLDVAARLKAKGYNHISLVLIGDGSEKARLVQSAKERGLENCQFLPPMPKHELMQYLPLADVGVITLEKIPAFAEGTSPNKFFDYLSVGLPILINHPGWISRKVQKVDCGVLAESTDEMVSALIQMSSDADSQSRRRGASLGLAESEFARDKLFAQYVVALHSAG